MQIFDLERLLIKNQMLRKKRKHLRPYPLRYPVEVIPFITFVKVRNVIGFQQFVQPFGSNDDVFIAQGCRAIIYAHPSSNNFLF